MKLISIYSISFTKQLIMWRDTFISSNSLHNWKNKHFLTFFLTLKHFILRETVFYHFYVHPSFDIILFFISCWWFVSVCPSIKEFYVFSHLSPYACLANGGSKRKGKMGAERPKAESWKQINSGNVLQTYQPKM